MLRPQVLADLALGRPLTGRQVIVTAHPDDETISASAVLCRARELTLVQLTTGAPPDDDAVTLQRRRERTAAFLAAGWGCRVMDAAVAGREAHEHLERLLAVVTDALTDVDVVWTHPYEGGHLDHDTCAWLVQTACARATTPPLRMEFASYHSTATAHVFGAFWPDRSVDHAIVNLGGGTLARKHAALAAYRSQAHILRKFPTIEEEPYRVAPVYDFSRPAPPPRCRWDVKGYAATSAKWRAAVAAALREIARAA